MPYQQTDTSPPSLAEKVARSMVSVEPVDPIGWAVARDEHGRGLYVVTVIMGSENTDKFVKMLEKLKPHMQPVDVFPPEISKEPSG